jgi:hypothetical protein
VLSVPPLLPLAEVDIAAIDDEETVGALTPLEPPLLGLLVLVLMLPLLLAVPALDEL